MIVVRVEEEDYLVALEDCNNHLHGRIILSKGDQPLTHLDLTNCSLCGKLSDHRKLYLGKGFYEFEFSL